MANFNYTEDGQSVRIETSRGFWVASVNGQRLGYEEQDALVLRDKVAGYLERSKEWDHESSDRAEDEVYERAPFVREPIKRLDREIF